MYAACGRLTNDKIPFEELMNKEFDVNNEKKIDRAFASNQALICVIR